MDGESLMVGLGAIDEAATGLTGRHFISRKIWLEIQNVRNTKCGSVTRYALGFESIRMGLSWNIDVAGQLLDSSS